MGLGFRSNPNLHRAQKRPIQSADRSTARWVAPIRVSGQTWLDAINHVLVPLNGKYDDWRVPETVRRSLLSTRLQKN